MKRIITKYEVAVQGLIGMLPRIYDSDTPLAHDETKNATCRAPNSNDDFIECPTCYDTFAKTDLLKNRCFPAGTQRRLTKLMPIIKSVDCQPQEGNYPYTMSSVSGDVTKVVDGRLPFEDHETKHFRDGCVPLSEVYAYENDDSDNEATVLDMALDDSENVEFAGIDAAEVERVHNELLHIYAYQAKAKLPQKHNHTANASVKGGMGSLQSTGQLWDPCKTGCGSKPKSDLEGLLGGIAAMVLMTIMYSARVARYDLLKPVAFLAKRITRWDGLCDKRLHRLICYIHKTKDDCMMGWIGDDPKDLTGRLFVDADFAGCPYTLKSTNGCHFDIQGPNSRFPVSAGCNGHTSLAQSSTEA